MNPEHGPGRALDDLAALESEDGDMVVLSFPVGPAAAESLTPAESAVATLLLEGRSNAEIAAFRRSSVRTVANQVATVFRKLGVGSRLELVASARLVNPGK